MKRRRKPPFCFAIKWNLILIGTLTGTSFLQRNDGDRGQSLALSSRASQGFED
ncbi:hypothetical protein CEV34_3056 [Brucella pseudogrignonensis]|uniref:Uncharacterized protein n=1 Tax=Brucella pseudogrignonensis TaxID=419475 RepID=A0A256GDA5_9HYPH|nr:hypothetical protein CEV34_3056 [Brucella pseudogrignonensis]